MATSIIANETTKSAKRLGQRLLVDTARMTVRRIGKNEQALLNSLKTLGQGERSTLVSFVNMLESKKRKRATAPVAGQEKDHG